MEIDTVEGRQEHGNTSDICKNEEHRYVWKIWKYRNMEIDTGRRRARIWKYIYIDICRNMEIERTKTQTTEHQSNKTTKQQNDKETNTWNTIEIEHHRNRKTTMETKT